jgi:hypothetical protein
MYKVLEFNQMAKARWLIFLACFTRTSEVTRGQVYNSCYNHFTYIVNKMMMEYHMYLCKYR